MRVISLVVAAIAVCSIVALIVFLATKNRNNVSSMPTTGKASYFDGSTLQWIGWRILTYIIMTLTLGIAYPWAMCMMMRWEVKHTVINGRRLKFTGNGAQLFGKYILWVFLTIITFGIYSIWFGLGMEKWKVKHTVYADDTSSVESKFTGGAGGWFLNHLMLYLLTLITFGIAYPWASVHITKWKARHTVIGGSPLIFEGRGLQLLGKYLLYIILTPLTLGIYALFFPVSLLKWQYKHTVALYRTAPIIALSHAHEEAAVKDYAKIRLAANDTELAMVKSGFNGNESQEELETLSQNGNPYAQYALALKLKGENERFEETALELLKSSSDGMYHPAMFDYSSYVENIDERINLLQESAKRGNADAPWVLKQLYENKADFPMIKNEELKLDLLTKSAYWFKVAIEFEVPEALNSKNEYEKLCERIAILHCGNKTNTAPSGISSGAIIGIIAGAIVLLIAAVVAVFLLKPTSHRDTEPNRVQTIPIAHGDGWVCTLQNGELFRYSDSKYKNYDFAENNFDYTDSNVSVEGYLSDTAYYDLRTKTLFIDFGITPDSKVNRNNKFSVYLVSENNTRPDGSCAVFSGAVEPGERIISVPCDLPSNITSTKIHVVVFNGLVSDRFAAAVPDSATPMGENIRFDSYDKWVMDIYSKRVNIVYEPIQSSNPNDGQSTSDSIPDDAQSVPEATPDNTPDFSAELIDKIVGSWTTAVLEGDTLYVTSFVFNANGTLEVYDSEYLNAADHPGLFGENATGWHPAPMGFPATYGTFSCNSNGSSVSLCYTHDDIEQFEPMYLTGNVLEINNDSMLFEVIGNYGDSQPRVFLKNQMYTSVEALCAMLNVDIY